MAEEKERNKLVIWSGGLDSTTLLNDLAKNSSKDNPILALSFETHFLNKRKVVKEREVRKNYLRYAKKKGYYINSRLVRVTSDVDITSKGWPQQVFWMSFILPYVPDDYDVYFGYVQGDCIWLAMSNFYKIFDEFRYIGNRYNIQLQFPFAYEEKWEILKKYQEAKIPYNCFWTCENPRKRGSKIQICGKCDPCIHLHMAKEELKFRKQRKAYHS